MPGSWADGAAGVAGYAGGSWDGFGKEGGKEPGHRSVPRDRGCRGLCAAREGKGCVGCCHFWHLTGKSAKGSIPLPALLVTRQQGTGLSAERGVTLQQVLWQSALHSSLEILSLPRALSPSRRALTLWILTCLSSNRGNPGWGSAWSRAPRKQAIGIEGPLSHLPPLVCFVGKGVVLHRLNTFSPSG